MWWCISSQRLAFTIKNSHCYPPHQLVLSTGGEIRRRLYTECRDRAQGIQMVHQRGVEGVVPLFTSKCFLFGD